MNELLVKRVVNLLRENGMGQAEAEQLAPLIISLVKGLAYSST